MQKILIATGNPHKIEEIQAICISEGVPFSLIGLGDISGGREIPEPHEGEPTFEGNARLKARYYAQKTGMPVFADDSGLEVDALGGAPGVLSARYSGLSGPRSVVDPANNKKLMAALRGVSKERRGARFVCALAFYRPEREGHAAVEAVVRGEFPGRILLDEECADPACPEKGRGENGFGYDPLLWLEDAKCTSAQLASDAKNARSHRGAAVRLMLKKLMK